MDRSLIKSLRLLWICPLLAAWPSFSSASDSLLDPTFGSAGIAEVTVGQQFNRAGRIAVQNDGKVVQVGVSRDGFTNTPEEIALVRFTADGILDTSFGTNGIARLNVGGGIQHLGSAVAIQADGKILAAGGTFIGSNYDIAMLRYDTAGVLDPEFGNAGVIIIDLGGSQSLRDIAFQSDGKIIAVGETIVGGNNRFLVMRLTTAGVLDTSFGTNGAVIESFSVNTVQFARSVALLNDDSIIVAGTGITPAGVGTISMLKLTANGALDTSFNSSGKLAVTYDANSAAASVAVDSAGRFLVGGYSSPTGSSNDDNFLVLRVNPNGSLDGTFGDQGIVRTVFAAPYTLGTIISTLILQDDGRILVAGNGRNPDQGFQEDLLIARYLEDGTLDPSLDGADGKLAFTRESTTRVTSVATQSVAGADKILVGAALATPSAQPDKFAVLRFMAPRIIFRDRFEGTSG